MIRDLPGWGPLRRCPLALITEDTWAVMEARRWMKDGFLPAPGGMGEQSETFVQAIRVIDAIVGEVRERERTAHEEELKRNRQKHGR